MYQLLSEIFFRDRGKFCRNCGLSDLPRSLADCVSCGIVLEEYEEKVSRLSRLLAYFFPVTTFVLAAVGARVLRQEGLGTQLVVLAFVVLNAVFSRSWLHGRDLRLRMIFSVPFWGIVTLFSLIIWLDFAGRAASSAQAVRAAVRDISIAPDAVPILALSDGTLAHGVGFTAYPYFRGLQARRLLRSGTGEVLLYIDSTRLSSPDGAIGAHGLVWSPPERDVRPGLELLVGGIPLTPEQRSTLDRSTYQSGVSFCYVGDRLWVIDGYRLTRISDEGKTEVFPLGKRDLGRLVKLSPDGSTVWLISSLGVTGISNVTRRKEFYPLAEFAAREGYPLVEIVAGSVRDGIAWLATSAGDVMRFDLEKGKLSYAGQAECPLYLDYYSLYTLPFILFSLVWTLRANFARPKT